MAITIATTGLPMKNLDTVALSLPGWRRRGEGRRVRLRVHHDAVLHLLQALGHDAFACLQPLGDDPEAVHLLPHLDRAERDLGVRSDDRDLVHALRLLHRALGHEEGTPGRHGARTFAYRPGRRIAS